MNLIDIFREREKKRIEKFGGMVLDDAVLNDFTQTWNTQPPKKRKKTSPQTTKLQDGYVALFTDGLVIGGKCKFTATKTDKFSGEAVFQITLVKEIL